MASAVLPIHLRSGLLISTLPWPEVTRTPGRSDRSSGSCSLRPEMTGAAASQRTARMGNAFRQGPGLLRRRYRKCDGEDRGGRKDALRMSVIPFHKPNWFTTTIRNRTGHGNPVLAWDPADPLTTRPADDFNQEIEKTRANQPLIKVLEARAKEPATARSLEAPALTGSR